MFSCFQKFRFLFRKNHLLLEPKLSSDPTDSFDSAATLLPLSIYQKFKIFSREPHLFLTKINFERFERSYSFSCFLQQIYYLSPFLKIARFFSQNPFFLAKNTISENFREISLFRSHWTSNWLTVSVAVDIKLAKFSCFQKFRLLFRKNHLLLEPKLSSNPTD